MTKIQKAWEVIIQKARELLEGYVETPLTKSTEISSEKDDETDSEYQESPKKKPKTTRKSKYKELNSNRIFEFILE
jgi:hypothetical protein